MSSASPSTATWWTSRASPSFTAWRGAEDGALVIGGGGDPPDAGALAPGAGALAGTVRDGALRGQRARARSGGTLGGNLAFSDPHSDPATFLLAAEAEVELRLGDARRTTALR